MSAGPCTGAPRRKLPTGHPSVADRRGTFPPQVLKTQGALGGSRRTAQLHETNLAKSFRRVQGAPPRVASGDGSPPAGAPSGRRGCDDDAEHWAEVTASSIAAPMGAWAAEAIRGCRRTKKSGKLIPSRDACRALERIGQSGEWAALPPTEQSLAITLLIDGAAMFPGVIGAALGRPGKPPPAPPATDDEGAPWAPLAGATGGGGP